MESDYPVYEDPVPFDTKLSVNKNAIGMDLEDVNVHCRRRWERDDKTLEKFVISCLEESPEFLVSLKNHHASLSRAGLVSVERMAEFIRGFVYCKLFIYPSFKGLEFKPYPTIHNIFLKIGIELTEWVMVADYFLTKYFRESADFTVTLQPNFDILES